MTWTPIREQPLKALLFKASDLNRGIERYAEIEIPDINSLRLLLMQVEIPVIIGFANEAMAPAEVEIVIYDDAIETNNSYEDYDD